MAELLLLVDGNNLAYRSRYTQGDKRGSKGRPSGVVYGSLHLLRQLLQRFNPAGVLVAFDGGRHEKTRIDPTYKGYRGPKVLPKVPVLSPLGKVPRFIRSQRMPRVGGPREKFPAVQAPLLPPDDRFLEQVDDLYRLVQAAGLPSMRLKGFEADSVIGALVQLTEAKGVPVIIVSADHDFYQLVTERVRVYDDVKKVLWDIEAVTDHYQLVVPREVSVYKALAGDTSDHVKGVVGCGPVMALKAIDVLRRELGQAPYVHRLSDPPDARTRRVVAALQASGLPTVAEQVPALVRSYQLVDIPRAGRAILADPPWRFENRTGKVAPEHRRLLRYPTMALEEIGALPVVQLAEPRAHLYLWVPNALLAQGLWVMSHWGFTYKTHLVWTNIRKDGGPDGRGVGFYFRNVTELVLFGVRGVMRTLGSGRHQVNLLATRKREHSRKPDELYDIIEACSPGPFLELFARYPRPGWTSWGRLDEAVTDAVAGGEVRSGP